jgi:hypothetical protein
LTTCTAAARRYECTATSKGHSHDRGKLSVDINHVQEFLEEGPKPGPPWRSRRLNNIFQYRSEWLSHDGDLRIRIMSETEWDHEQPEAVGFKVERRWVSLSSPRASASCGGASVSAIEPKVTLI